MVEKTIGEHIQYGMELLKDLKNSNIQLEVVLMLADILKTDKSYIYSHIEGKLSAENESIFKRYLNERVNGKPLQYIINSEEFMGLNFYVSEGVLIPRDDTEILVNTVMDIFKTNRSKEESLKILELGVGSGAISLSLAHYMENIEIDAVDISDTALSIAKKNHDYLKIKNKVEFYCGDMFEPIEEEKKYDLIISNPPYIESGEIEKLQVEILEHEPMLALDGGRDGLYFYRNIVSKSIGYLKTNGVLAFEIGYNQGDAVSKMMSKDFYNVEVIPDYSGLDRVVIGYRE